MRVTTMLLLAAICTGRGIVAGAEPPAWATPIALNRYVRGVVLPMDPAIFSPTECTVAFHVKVDKFTGCSVFDWGAQQERNRIVVSVGEAKAGDRGKLQFVCFDGRGVRRAIPGPEMPIGPLFFAFTFQDGQFRFYVDDKLAGTLNVGPLGHFSRQAKFITSYCEGIKCQAVQVFARALDGQELAALSAVKRWKVGPHTTLLVDEQGLAAADPQGLVGPGVVSPEQFRQQAAAETGGAQCS